MARWEPNAIGRLTEAAMQLFGERGYAKTTVEDIAARAGLTERTFFRYFTDKREVLFAGSDQFVKQIVDAVRAAPKASTPLDAALAGHEATSDFFAQRRAFARKRSAVIAAHPELQERELIKLMALAAAITAALEERGVSSAAASLAAEAGLAIFRVGFEHWLKDAKNRSLVFHLRAARRQLEAVVVGPRATRRA
ncbi:MAG TPA: TetR family transcriptional regulator [Kofleriaceae bacterium]|nr:TetR family transcriptional regulator [Kofleriaceae bacterium]